MKYKPKNTCKEIQTFNHIKYTIDTVYPFAIYAWNTDNQKLDDDPFWYQPHDLLGNDWESKEAAEKFALDWLDQHFSTKS